jgi:hypothetical protein
MWQGNKRRKKKGLKVQTKDNTPKHKRHNGVSFLFVQPKLKENKILKVHLKCRKFFPLKSPYWRPKWVVLYTTYFHYKELKKIFYLVFASLGTTSDIKPT